jgi:hypothetical protein
MSRYETSDQLGSSSRCRSASGAPPVFKGFVAELERLLAERATEAKSKSKKR